ncbi:hypothetical protein HZC31_01205 [Candidatus Woesearchaeota archaeon]|nr:hypothetical protein [Candidatus Woesearchaeota archaeon]
MKQKRIKQLIALFMIFLFTSLPVAFASTTMTINSYAGKDEVAGYLSTYDDYLAVEVEVTPDTETDTFANFSEDNIYVNVFGKKEAFDSCEQDGDDYICAYTTSTADRTAAEKTLTISVIDDDSSIAAEEETTVYIDGENPTFVSARYPNYFTDAVNISVELEDETCTSCGSDVCSGFDRLEIWMNNTIKQNISINGEAGDCDYETVFETSVTDLGASEGAQQICLYIYDNVQNTNKRCSSITVDSQGPSISTSSFVIKDDNQNPIEHISDTAIHATVSVNITETGAGLDTSTVYANLSNLNDEIEEDYNEMEAACDEYEDGLFICSWDIYVDTAETSATVKIYAEDNAGNSNVLTKTVGFIEDSTAPIVVSLTSAFDDYFNAKNNTLTLEIQEDGSGFDDLNVYLDLSELQLGSKQADSCSQSGTSWYCYWESFAIPSSVSHGENIDIVPDVVTDDAGNDFDATTVEEVSFVYDEEAPIFLNVTMGALGREADVITEGDVVYILAYLEEDVSGLEESNVLADYSAFEDSNENEEASYCTEVNDNIWECYWEYTGALDTGEDVELTMIATDNAGNTKDSDDDDVVAESHVVSIVEGEVDYWDAEADVDDLPYLNPNFLYFTSSGTIIRLDTELESASGTVPYIHAYQIQSCQAGVFLAENQTAAVSMYDAAIVGQYYYDTADKSAKYALVNIPSFFYGKVNMTVSEGSTIEITCTATVTQARSMYADIYSPDEEVNITTSVPLMGGLYTEPSLASVDKIQTMAKFIETLGKITNFLGKWTEWGTKICSPINGVRVIANNLVTILKAINTLAVGEATGVVAGGVKVTNTLNNVWYGYYSKDEVASAKGETITQTEVGDTGVMENQYRSGGAPFSNKYKMLSLGYLCDTVLCESCSENWNELLLKGQRGETETIGGYVGGEWVPNLLGQKFTFPFNPRENLVIALVCNPPCVPGLYAQLNVYYQILIAYNTCLNVAVAKGEDVMQCEQFLSAQICQNVVNAFFWHWFYGLKNLVVANAVGQVFDFIKETVFNCPTGEDSEANPIPLCSTWRGIMALTTIVTTVVDTVNTVQGLFNMNWNLTGNETAEEQQDALETDVETNIGDQLGTTPSYG